MTTQEKLKRMDDSPSAAQSHFEEEQPGSDINDAVSRLVNGPSKEYEVCACVLGIIICEINTMLRYNSY